MIKMKILMSKLSSRKFWMALIGVVIGIMIAEGEDVSVIQTVAGGVASTLSVLSYILMEGGIDIVRAKSTESGSQQPVKETKEEN